MQWFDQPGGPRPGELLKSHVIVSDHSLSRPVGSDSTSLDQRVSNLVQPFWSLSFIVSLKSFTPCSRSQ